MTEKILSSSSRRNPSGMLERSYAELDGKLELVLDRWAGCKLASCMPVGYRPVEQQLAVHSSLLAAQNTAERTESMGKPELGQELSMPAARTLLAELVE